MYFSNVNWGNSERLFVMVLPVRGEPFFVAPAFEKDRALEQIAPGPFRQIAARLHLGRERKSLSGGGVRAEGARPGDRQHRHRRARDISCSRTESRARLPAATIASATEVTAGCRMIKSPAEIALMRLANSVTLQAYEAAWQSMREGMTQHEFAALVSSGAPKAGIPGRRRRAGGRVFGAAARIGEAAGDPRRNHSADRRRLLGGTLPVRHQPHVRARQTDGQDEARVRYRASGAKRGARRRPSGRGLRRRGRGRAQSDRRRRLRAGIQILHASRGPRNRNGWPRVAVSDRHQHAAEPAARASRWRRR